MRRSIQKKQISIHPLSCNETSRGQVGSEKLRVRHSGKPSKGMNPLWESLCAASLAEALEAPLPWKRVNSLCFVHRVHLGVLLARCIIGLPIHTNSITERTGGGDWVPSFPVSKTRYAGGVLVGDRSHFADVVPPAMLKFTELRRTSLRLGGQKKQ